MTAALSAGQGWTWFEANSACQLKLNPLLIFARTDAVPDLNKAEAGDAHDQTQHGGWIFGRVDAALLRAKRQSSYGQEQQYGNDVTELFQGGSP